MEPEYNHGLDFDPNPIAQFQSWYALARKKELNDPDAMSLATMSRDGTPNVRMVLCKGFTHDGVRFFTNTESTKGIEIAANANVAICFHWKSLLRQVRVQGVASKLPDAENDEYFHTRHRESQIGAWASAQSRPLENTMQLVTNVYAAQEQFKGQKVARPPYWGGYLITPHTIEFWAQRPHRLHERMLYTVDGNGWQMQRLYP